MGCDVFTLEKAAPTKTNNSSLQNKDGLKKILMSVFENTLTVFFTTLAVGYATRILSKKKRQRKTTPRRPKRKKGGNSHR